MNVIRILSHGDIEPALYGGLFLSAGGRGMESMAGQRAIAEQALAAGPVRLVSADEMAPDASLIVATGIGAPGGGKPKVKPADSVEAARLLISMLGRTPAGVICGHVPGFNAWIVAASLGIDYIDLASNGRGHPTVAMGGMGLASRPDIVITQTGVGGETADGDRLSVTATGNILLTEKILRWAAAQNGGLVMAARGPITAGFAVENGASGAISFQLDLGAAMLAARASERVAATVDFLGGCCLVQGRVVTNSVTYGNGFDVGVVVVEGREGRSELGVFNELMTATVDGERVATFPDMIGTLDPASGNPLAVSRLRIGDEVAVITAPRSKFPIGKGALDPAVYPEAEEAMGVDLRSYL
nr:MULTISPECIES: DUF917 family protein [Chelativorans]